MYAIWTANTYTVEYYQGNNSTTAGSTKISTMANTTHTYGVASNLRAYAGTAPSGWTFAGWSTTESGTTRTYANNASVTTAATGGTLKLYAVYSRNLTMAYNGNGNTGGSTASHTSPQYYNTNGGITSVTFTTKTNGFTKTGHTFSKWANDSTSGAQVAAG